jgi:hypothetical protein
MTGKMTCKKFTYPQTKQGRKPLFSNCQQNNFIASLVQREVDFAKQKTEGLFWKE